MSHDPPFDPGLQPERTFIAWRRTALALCVALVGGARLSLPVVGAVAVWVGVIGVAVAVLVYLTVAFRYRQVHEALSAGESESPAGGAPLAALAGVASLLAIGALVYVLALV